MDKLTATQRYWIGLTMSERRKYWPGLSREDKEGLMCLALTRFESGGSVEDKWTEEEKRQIWLEIVREPKGKELIVGLSLNLADEGVSEAFSELELKLSKLKEAKISRLDNLLDDLRSVEVPTFSESESDFFSLVDKGRVKRQLIRKACSLPKRVKSEYPTVLECFSASSRCKEED